jgi:hypothetical protein
MASKRAFVAEILEFLKTTKRIKSWVQSGGRDRHDYEVRIAGDHSTVIEAKGCLDGANTTIFERPPQADEFIIWSLCQNAGADPRKNAWSGIHTRLSADIMHRGQRVDAVVIWDMLCGTLGRPCPKLVRSSRQGIRVGPYTVPPPCIYLFPRSVPDPRNNPSPPTWRIDQLPFAKALHETFGGEDSDLTYVEITASMRGATPERVTRLMRSGAVIYESDPAQINRAKR